MTYRSRLGSVDCSTRRFYPFYGADRIRRHTKLHRRGNTRCYIETRPQRDSRLKEVLSIHNKLKSLHNKLE